MVFSHPQHVPAAAALSRVLLGQDKGSVCCHSLAELYAVLTRLPLSPSIHPSEAHRLIDANVLAHFQLVPLTVEDYRESLRALAAAGWAGGLIYDALLLRAAEKCAAEQVFTFNASHFRRLAHGRELCARIGAP
ncbi:MAG TPA: PIN domain-containing protein [Chthoniobacterales bacterium]